MPEAPGAPERRHPSTPDTSSAVGRSPRPSGSRPRPRARAGDREQLLLRAVDEVEVRPLPVALELPCTLIKEKLPLWCCVHRKWRMSMHCRLSDILRSGLRQPLTMPKCECCVHPAILLYLIM